MRPNNCLVLNRDFGVVRSLRFLLLLSGFMVCASPVWAANHYVRAGATGNGSGSDWNNASTALPATLVRGNTYYVAGGTYPAYVFDDAESGTALITVKRATAADHGTDVGWQAGYDAQAAFANNLRFRRGYYVFDGSVGSGNNAASYGFKVNRPANCSAYQLYIEIVNSPGTLTNVTVSHTAIDSCGPSFDFDQHGIFVGCFNGCVTNNIVISHNYLSGLAKTILFLGTTNSTVEHNYLTNHWSSSSNHGEQMFAVRTVGIIYRHNVVNTCRGTACIAALDPGTVGMDNWEIYGNLFIDGRGGNGVIATGTQASIVISNTKVYNNTVVNSPSTFFFPCNGACSSSSGNVVRNNLVWNSTATISQGSSQVDHDYNSFISASGTIPTEPNRQTGSFNPFVNSSAGDYHLVQGGGTGANQVHPGGVLSAPYNMDMAGNLRGADGVWERGAYEFNSNSTARPNPAQNLTVIVR